MAPQKTAKTYDEDLCRWLVQPDIPPCADQDWRPDGESYQSQLYCLRHKTPINPSGFTCKLCRAGQWPEHVAARAAIEAMVRDGRRDDARRVLIRRVEMGTLPLARAEEIARDLLPEESNRG